MGEKRFIVIPVCVVLFLFSLVIVLNYIFYCIYWNFCERRGHPPSNNSEDETIRHSNINRTVRSATSTLHPIQLALENSVTPKEIVTLATNSDAFKNVQNYEI